jgi:TIR domain
LGCPDGLTFYKEGQLKDLFFCHADADKAWVRDLGARLEAERIGNRNIEVFFDEWDIDHGENIVAKIDEGLEQARFCAVVLSPAMLKREWPQAEWTARFMAAPSGRKGQLIPILLHERDPETRELIDIPMLLRPIRRFDFTKSSNFEAEFQDLLRKLRGERPRRGGWHDPSPYLGASEHGAEAADDVQEMLVSNLLPVEAHPQHVWSDAATTQKSTDVWNSLRGQRVPPFLLADGRLYSFFNPDSADNPFRSFMPGMARKRENVADWIRDPIRSRQLVRMLNDALQEHNYHLRIRNFKDNRKQFYCPVFDGNKPRVFRWGGGGKGRTIAKVAERADKSAIGIHYSARMRFMILGSRIFLLVEPGWMFTSDGITPLEGKQVTVLSTKFGGKERNAAVLRNVLMWGMLLANREDRIRIGLGGAELVVDPVPALASVPVGVDGDAMNLDRIFSEGAGGEVADDEGGNDEELDEVLAMAVTGALGSEVEFDFLDEEGE